MILVVTGMGHKGGGGETKGGKNCLREGSFGLKKKNVWGINRFRGEKKGKPETSIERLERLRGKRTRVSQKKSGDSCRGKRCFWGS